MRRQALRLAVALAAVSAIVGVSGCGGGEARPTVDSSQSLLQRQWSLTLLEDDGWTEIYGTNPRGEVVGYTGFDGLPSLWNGRTGARQTVGELGGTVGFANDVNARGQVVGLCDIAPDAYEYHAFLWEHGVAADLGTLNDEYPVSRAIAINAAGEIVGEAAASPHYPGNRDTRALMWNRAHQLIDLGTLDPEAGSTAVDINAAGVVVGSSGGQAVVWHNGVIQGLGGFTPPDSTFEYPTDGLGINANGTVLGAVLGHTAGSRYVMVWRNGAWAGVGDLGGKGTRVTDRRAMNASGQVAGWSNDADGHERAFFWNGAVMQDLGTLGGTEAQAVALNDSGHVVGSAQDEYGQMRGFLWHGGELVALDSLVAVPDGAVITRGEFIGNDGSIVVMLWTEGVGQTAAVMRPSH